ncbi:putative zinc-binding domain-containing protein, partial [Dysosmobacter welbionis]
GNNRLGPCRRLAGFPQGFQFLQALTLGPRQTVLSHGISPLVVLHHISALPAAVFSQVDAAAAWFSSLCHGANSFPKISVIKVSMTWAACRCISP